MTGEPSSDLDVLREHLFRIPDPEFRALVHELESRRRGQKISGGISAVMNFLRPRLAILRPPRQMTLLRLMCDPIEDILYSPGGERKAIGKIPRNSLKAIWRLMTRNANGDVLSDFEAELSELPLQQQTKDNLHQIGYRFWPFCAETLRGVIVTAEGSTKLRRALINEVGGDLNYASLKEMAMMLEVAAPISKLRDTLSPAPIVNVSNRDIEVLVEAFTRVNEHGSQFQECVIYVILARLANMTLITDVFKRIDEIGAGSVITHVSDTAAQAMVSQIEDLIKDVDDEIEASTEGEQLTRQMAEFVATALDGINAIGRTGSRQQARRIGQVKGELAQKVRESVVEKEDAQTVELLTALLNNNFEGVEDVEATDEGIPAAVLEQMQDRIVSLRVAERFAGEIGIGGEVEQRLNEIMDSLDQRADRLIKAIGEGDDAFVSRQAAQANLHGTVRLIELVVGPERADEIRLRGQKLLDGSP